MGGETPVWLLVPIHPSLPLRFSTGFAYYGLAMSVAEFGVNLCFLQLIFGGVDFPAKFIHFLSINHLGQHSTLASGLLLAGGCILTHIFVPSGEKLGLHQNPLKEGQRVSGRHGLPRAGKRGARDSKSADSTSKSLCYLNQVPALSGAHVSHLENNSVGLDDIEAPF